MIVFAVGWYILFSDESQKTPNNSDEGNSQLRRNESQQDVSRRDSPSRSGSSDGPREAADAYIKTLEQQGIVFGSQFRTMMRYPNLFPPTIEVIYLLDYTNQAGDRIAAPYTITTKRSANGWEVVGGSPGDRTNLNTNPVRGTDGVWRRSPMENFMGDAMGRGNRK